MIHFRVQHKKVSEKLLMIDKDIQKVMKRAINGGNRAAHREGYKILSKPYCIEKEEYKKRRTSIKNIRIGDFRKNKDLKASIRASTRKIGLLRFATNKSRTPLRDKRRASRRKVIINFRGTTSTVVGGFIARPTKKGNSNQVFTKHKKQGEWKWKREGTKSLYQLMTKETTQARLESAADRVVKRILERELEALL